MRAALSWCNRPQEVRWCRVVCNGEPMRIERLVPNPAVDDLARAVDEHQAMLGMKVLMDHGWIVTLGGDDGHHLSLIASDASAPLNPDVSVFVDDVHEALQRATDAGPKIVHPLTHEPWGVPRFFSRDSSGRVVNVGTHSA